MQRKSALVHNEAADEADALAQVRWFLRYLPRSIYQLAPVIATDDSPDQADDWPKNATPHDRRKIFDPRRILKAVFDQDSLIEIGRYQWWPGGDRLCASERNSRGRDRRLGCD